jgi:tetratricopeptide (TPR) repeat protein
MHNFELKGMNKYTEVFRNILDKKAGGVLTVSGKGGSGKSEILSAFRLVPALSQKDMVYASLDFGMYVNVDPELGLLALRAELIRSYKINFSFFDVAYALYLVRTNQEKKLDRDLELYTTSKILNEVLGVSGAKGNEFVNKLYFTVERDKPAVSEWWKNGGGVELNRLMEQKPEYIRKHLTDQWASDLKLALGARRCVIMLDSYENIFEEEPDHSREEADRWVKNLISLLPQTLFVIAGRQIPVWKETDAGTPEVFVNMEAGNFEREDCAAMLTSLGLGKRTADAVFASSRGNRFLTTLLAYGLTAVKNETGKDPEPDDVEYGTKEIMQFYTATMEGLESDMARLLSVCRYFNKDLFEYLIYEFIPEGVGFTFSDYCMLPIANAAMGLDYASLKKPFRDEIYASLSSDQKDNIHFSLFNYYLRKIDREKGNFRSFTFYINFRECFHHAKAALDGEGFVDWFLDFHDKYFSNDKMSFWIHLHREMVDYLKGLMGLIHPYTASAIEKLAQLYCRVEDYESAEPLMKRIINIREKLGGEESQETIRSRNRLASLYSSKGDFHAAREVMQKNVDIKSRSAGTDHPETLKYLQRLASLALKSKDFKVAADLGERSLRLHVQRLGREHADTMKSMSELAAIQEQAGNYERSCELYKEVLDIREEILGGSHPDTAKSISQLAFYFFRRGDYDSAEPLFYRALEAKEHNLGKSHPLLAPYYNNLAYIYYCKEKYDKAEPMYEQALKIKEKNFGASHPSTVTGITNLASLKFRQGDIAKAEELFRKAMELSRSTFGENHPSVATDINNLAFVISRKGEFGEAEALYRRALGIREENLGEHPDTAASLNNLAEVLYRKGELDESVNLFERALELSENFLGEAHPNTVLVNRNLEKIKNLI